MTNTFLHFLIVKKIVTLSKKSAVGFCNKLNVSSNLSSQNIKENLDMVNVYKYNYTDYIYIRSTLSRARGSSLETCQLKRKPQERPD